MISLDIQIILIILNIFTPTIFFIDKDAIYHTCYFRQILFYLQFFNFLSIGVLGTMKYCKAEKSEKFKFGNIIIYALIPVVAGIAQYLDPNSPFYSIGFMLSCLVIFVFTITQEQQNLFINKINTNKKNAEIKQQKLLQDQIEILTAITTISPTIVFANLTANECHSTCYDNLRLKETNDSRKFDDFIKEELSQIASFDKQKYENTFSRENLIQSFNEGKDYLSLEYRKNLENQETCWLRATATFVSDANDKENIRLIMLFQNITKIKIKEFENERLTKTITSLFGTVIKIDMVNDVLYKIQVDKDLDKLFPIYKSASETLNNWLKDFCTQQNYEQYKDFWDFSTLQQRFAEDSHLSLEVNTIRGWIQIIAIPLSRNKQNEVTEFISLTQTINKQKQNEIEHAESIAKAYKIVSSLTKSYSSCFNFDIDNNSFLSLKENSAEISKENDFSDSQLLIKKLISNLPNDSSKVMRQFLNFKTLNERMSKRDYITTEFVDENNEYIRSSLIVSNRDSEGHIKSVTLASQNISDEVESRIALKQAITQAHHDSLTGLLNRYGFNKELDAIYKKQHKKTVSAIIMDIDNFKKVNDTYSHEAGDLVLKMTADNILKLFRKKSLCCRWGGEEFLVFTYDNSTPDKTAEQLRLLEEESSVTYDNQTIKVTISIGICITENIEETSIASLINTADKCLYISKNNGKNQTTTQNI